MSEKVCGDIFYEGFRKYLGDNPTVEQVKLWHAGFATGQAEKIHLGACHGCMFRIGPQWREHCLPIDYDVAQRYGLQVVEVNEEVWLVDEEGASVLIYMLDAPMNSPRWHQYRAYICGIAVEDVDINYHEREGYRGRTD